MKKIVSIAASTFILLAGCSNESSDEAKKNEDTKPKVEKTEEKSSVETKEVTDNSTETEEKVESTEDSNGEVKDNKENKIEKEQDVANLDEETKIALAFFIEKNTHDILSKEDILTGRYSYVTPEGEQSKLLYRLILNPIDPSQVTNAPNDMNFYSIYPNITNAISVIGVSDSEILVGSTQNGIPYDQFKKYGNVYDLQEIYDKYKDLTSLPELASKVEITDLNPLASEDTKIEFETNENAASMLTVKHRVYDKIIAFEGISDLQSTGLLWDDVRHDEKTNQYYVNYRNKNAEILGTYRTSDSGIEKFDAQGNKIGKGF